jgi:Enoyl-CoA hydratase/carnithine racemase
MEFVASGKVFVGAQGHVRVVEFRRGPENFFDFELIRNLEAVFNDLGRDPACRSIVLASEGKAFCAGASYAAMQGPVDPEDLRKLYDAAGARARRYAQAGRREAECRNGEGDPRKGRAGEARRRRCRAGRQLTRRVRRLHQEGDRALGAGGQGVGRSPRLTAV